MHSNDYIDGVFSYCDRWCERCRLTDRCRLADDVRLREAAHRAAGEDPNDWDIVIQDVAESLTDAISMIREEAARLGFDIDKMGGDELKRMLEKGVTAEEMEGEEGVASRVAEVVKTHMSETRGARGTANQQMMQLLNLYTDKNTQFVNAVNHALGGEGDVGESARALSGAKEDASAATPPWYQRLWGAVAG